MKMSKFHLVCSCLVCHLELTVQNLNQHFDAHFPKEVATFCPQCNQPVSDKKFCNRSCAARYNNARKDYTKFKTGPKKGTIKGKIPWNKGRGLKHPPNSQNCSICDRLHIRKGKTCSQECQNILFRKSIHRAYKNGYNPQLNRGRHKRSFLEQSFEDWLLLEYPDLEFEMERPFKNSIEGKYYYADFFFPFLNLIIELDGDQHSETVDYDQHRDQFLKETYGVRVYRISAYDYTKKIKINEIKHLLERTEGVKPSSLGSEA